MAIIFRIFFFFTVIGLGFLLIISWFLSSKRTSAEPSLKDKYLELLRETTDRLRKELIPIDLHEIKILTWKLFPVNSQTKVEAGYVQTIFQEKLFAYSIINESSTAVIEVLSSEASYTFEREEENTKVFLSTTLLGTIKETNELIVLEDQVDRYTVSKTLGSGTIISKKEKKLAQIYLGSEADSFSDSDRLFTMLFKLDGPEQEILIVLVLYLLLVKLNNT